MNPQGVPPRRLPEDGGSRKAFTLLELLIVIALTGILSALIVPMAKGSMTAAKSSKCASNLKRLAEAVLQYAADNDGKIPASIAIPGVAGAKDGTWKESLAPYVTVPQGGFAGDSIFFCPEGRSPRDWSNSASDYTCNDRADAASTTGVFVQQAWGTSGGNVRLQQIVHPGKVILFADSFVNSDVRRSGGWGVFLSRLGTATYLGGSTLPVQGLAPRHGYVKSPLGGKFNASFCDGHVESFDWKDPRFQDAAFRRSLVDTQ